MSIYTQKQSKRTIKDTINLNLNFRQKHSEWQIFRNMALNFINLSLMTVLFIVFSAAAGLTPMMAAVTAGLLGGLLTILCDKICQRFFSSASKHGMSTQEIELNDILDGPESYYNVLVGVFDGHSMDLDDDFEPDADASNADDIELEADDIELDANDFSETKPLLHPF